MRGQSLYDYCMEHEDKKYLLDEWDYEKNEKELGISPKDVARGSSKKVWWKCEKGHEYEAVIGVKMTQGTGCPYCSGHRVLKGFNDLCTTHPELLKEWNYEKNIINPEEVSKGCNEKVWWYCSTCNNSYKMGVDKRTLGRGCPYCSGNKVLSGFNDLETTHPELLKDWDYERNSILPSEITSGSDKKVWWVCEKGHHYDSIVGNRTRLNVGCPYCDGKKVLKGFNDFASNYPELLKEWDYDKNDILPDEISRGSQKKVWWKCDKGHSYDATISHRVIDTTGCPYCSNQKVLIGFNDLATTHSELSKEWHSTKNIKLTPYEITSGSTKKVWWKCSVCGHEWKAIISSRSKGVGCPQCAKESHSSFPEQAIYYYLAQVYKEVKSGSIDLLDGKLELDIYIPELKTAVEYDGVKWHKDIDRDLKKNKLCIDKGIRLIRIREWGLPDIEGSINIFRSDKGRGKDLDEVIIRLFSLLGIESDVNIERDKQLIYSLYVKGKKDNSLVVKFPDIAKEWHPTKNGNLTPENVSYGSDKKVWWLCDKGHEWQALVSNRVKGHSCVYCSNREVLKDYNDLVTTHPDVAKEWHPTKNGTLKPEHVSYGSSKKVWWQCKEGHEWAINIANRTVSHNNCPYCSGRLAIKGESDLLTTHYDIACLWNSIRNADLTPDKVSQGSNKRVWWICNECGHEYQRPVHKQVNIRGIHCPECAKKNRKS